MKKLYVLIIGSVFSINLNAQSHLLLSEIALTPEAGEFIEIFNPTSNSISLNNYYLSDNADYAMLPSGTTAVINSDLIVQFPAGFTIGPNQVLTVAASSLDFNATYGINPDFEVGGTDPNVPDMYLIDVGAAATLTNVGEGIILFYWDGTTDLVSDVDMMNAGVPSAANQITTKTGIAVDGPDANTSPSSYLNDAVSMPLQASTPGPGFTTKRILLEGTNETHSGGNGIIGDDETTENILITWDATFTAPTPGITNITIGIASLEDQNFSIYPNPSKNYFRVLTAQNSQVQELKIYDITGKIVYMENILSNQTIIYHKLNPGLYFVTGYLDSEIFNAKLIIE